MRRFFNRYLLWPLLLLGHFLAASLLAWHLLAQVDFAYPLGYELLDIDEHVQTFGPQNNYKDHFEKTSPAEHKRLFSEITEAIQAGGENLAAISYTLPNGEQEPLMRAPEVVHLQDVARLVKHFYWAGIGGFLIAGGLLIYAYRRQLKMPSARTLLTGFGVLLLTVAAAVFAIGPLKVFYWLHDYAFPPEHPWFFYYQDSLMTTMMKAPDLFGFITALLVPLALAIWGLSLWGIAQLLKRRKTK